METLILVIMIAAIPTVMVCGLFAGAILAEVCSKSNTLMSIMKKIVEAEMIGFILCAVFLGKNPVVALICAYVIAQVIAYLVKLTLLEE